MKLSNAEIKMIKEFVQSFTDYDEIRLRRYEVLLDYDRPETKDTIISIHLWKGYHTVAHLKVNINNYPTDADFHALVIDTSYSLKRDFENYEKVM